MEPSEIELLSEKQLISVVPNFNGNIIHLICGDFGPFRASLPTLVPLWVAVYLKKQIKCKIVPPDWMDVDTLETVKEAEKNSKTFTKMPSEHYMVVAKLLLDCAADDIPQADEIRTIIKDVWDIRMAKLRNSMDLLVRNAGCYAAVDNLTRIEINSVRPLFPHALDHLHRMKLAKKNTGIQTQQATSSLSRSINSFSR